MAEQAVSETSKNNAAGTPFDLESKIFITPEQYVARCNANAKDILAWKPTAGYSDWTGTNAANANGAYVAWASILPFPVEWVSNQPKEARIKRNLNWNGDRTIFGLYRGINIDKTVLDVILHTGRANRTGTDWESPK